MVKAHQRSRNLEASTDAQHWEGGTRKSKRFLIEQYIRFAPFSSWIRRFGFVENSEVRFWAKFTSRVVHSCIRPSSRSDAWARTTGIPLSRRLSTHDPARRFPLVFYSGTSPVKIGMIGLHTGALELPLLVRFVIYIVLFR